MDLGKLGLWTFQLDVQPAAQARDAVVELEELGFKTVWVPEAFGREPFVNATMLLAATESLNIATGIASIHARTAMTMQAGWKALTEAFPDRFLLGLGVSHQPMVEGVHGLGYDKPYSTMVTYLDQMDGGMYFGAPSTTPPQRVLAALGPKMLKLAAERGLGAHPYFVPVEHTSIARAALGPDAVLAPEQMAVFETDPEIARGIARTAMSTYLGLPNYTNNLRRLGWGDDDLLNGGSDKLVDAIVVWGDVDAVVERVKDHLARGADHVCVQVLPVTPTGLPMDAWRSLAAAIPSL
ncbi:MAG: LLM class F420-dependent oxidoreductase [Ilumatobacteraceae bacterium]